MSDIQSGDVVKCIAVNHGLTVLRVGKLYRVRDVGTVRNCFRVPEFNGLPCLWLDGVCDTACGNGYLASRFRKIGKSDEGFAEWMRSLKPAPAIGMPCLHEDALARLSPEGVAARAEGIAQNPQGHPQQ